MTNGFFSVNEHPIDRVVRVIVGVVILSLAFFGPKSPWALFGLVPLITGIVGTCPVYRLFGISTCSTKHGPTPT